MLKNPSHPSSGWSLPSSGTAGTIAEPSSSAGIESWQVLNLLTSLADKSLIRLDAYQDAARYRVLDTVRYYGAERLQSTGEEEAMRGRHLAYFTALAEKLEPLLHGHEQFATLDALEREHDNLRTALDHGSPEQVLRLGAAIFWFWHLHCHNREGRARLESALVRAPVLIADRNRAKAFQGAGQLAFYQSDYAGARGHLDQSASVWREIGDPEGLAGALVYLGPSCQMEGDRDLAEVVLGECLECARRSGDRRTIAMALWMWAIRFQLLGRTSEGAAELEESAALFRELGDSWGFVGPAIYLAEVRLVEGNPAAARELLEEGLAVSRKIGDRWRISGLLDTLGEVNLFTGDLESARDCIEQSLAICREQQNARRIAYELRNLGHTARRQGRLTEARDCYTESLGIYRELGDKRHVANVIDGFARLAGALGQADLAARLFGASDAMREEAGTQVPPADRPDHAACASAVRSELGEARFAELESVGRSLSLEHAIAVALENAKD